MTSSVPRARQVIAAAVLCCASALAAGCGSPSSSPTAPATITITTTPPAGGSTSPAPSSPTAASTASTGSAGAAACPTSSLTAKLGQPQGTAGSIYVNIDLTNVSSVTCTLYGYPGVSLTAKKSGTQVQVGASAQENAATSRKLVTLAPGAAAHALVQITEALNYPPSACGPVGTDFLKVYPPNQRTPIFVAYSGTGCSKPKKILTVDAVRAGSGG